MTKNEIKKLSPQTIVVRNKNPLDIGMVFEVSNNGFYVIWKNGQKGWIAFADAKKYLY